MEDAPVERVPLGRLLVDAGFLSRPQLDDCLAEGSKTGERIGEVVVRRGLATEDDVARLLAEQWGLDYVERSAIWFDGNALAKLSREDAQRWEALPTRIEGGRVVVAVAEPTEQRIAAVRELIGEETVLIVVPKSALDAGLRSQLLSSRGGQFDSGTGEEPPVDPVALDTIAAPADDLELGELDVAEQSKDGEPEPARKLMPVPPLPDLDLEPEPQPKSKSKSAKPKASAEPSDGREPGVDADPDAEADAVDALAAEARAVAERLAAQAEAVRQRAHEQTELRAQTEAYESRISTLEQELDARKEQLERLREQLRSTLDLAAE